MRAWIGRLALLLGVFAIVASGVAIFWGSDSARRIPLDTDSITQLSGTVSGALAKSETPVPGTYVNYTQVDPKASDGDVVAMAQTSCVATGEEFCIDLKGNFLLNEDDPTIVNIGQNKFALDRRTGVPVEDQAAFIKDATEVLPYAGVVAKFPFDVEKKSYEFWDGILMNTTTAEYIGSKKIDGVETYQFDVKVPKTPAHIAPLVLGTYEMEQSIWVNKQTGAYIDQVATQTLATPDGTVMLAADFRYTDDTVKRNVEAAKDQARSLFLVDVVARWGGLVLGILLIGASVVLLRRPRQA